MHSKNKKYKSIFWGSPAFALPSLEACYENSELVAVLSQPDKPRGRGHEVFPTEVRQWAIEKGIPNFTPKSLRKIDEEGTRLLEFLNTNKVDYFVVVAYGNLLPDSILSLPLKACINLHASLLPRWRGAAPIQRALEAGDAETGVCLQKMVKELDAGDVILEKKLSLSLSDDAKTLTPKLAVLGAELISEFLKTDYEKLSFQPQDPSGVSLAAKIQKAEGLWNATWTAETFLNKLRAFSQWPSVRMSFKNSKNEIVEIKIIEGKLSAKQLVRDIEIESDAVFIKCSGEKSFQVTRAQFPGKGPADAKVVFERLLNEYSLVK